ncbi:MAG TPA: lytic murein transglycosylase [Thermodesulfobacteriota bacterium]|nr:lytic murein transglycosylase [Thermodesulfobacteriota bacterium]
MKKRSPNREIRFLILTLLVSCFSVISASESNEISSPFQDLIHRLSEDGFDSEFLSNLFMDTRTELNLSLMTLSLESRETADLYTQFLTQEAVLLSKKFLRQNSKVLKKAEDRFSVEKEVIVAILLVESRFGENIGKYRLIPTLASIAVMDSPDTLQRNYLILRDLDPDLSYEWIERLAKRRANRAYYELKCFLNIVQHETIDPLEVYGSYAGALGMAQFMPSSYLSYALHPEGFENWLLNKEAGIFSIGNYLKSHGWRKRLTMEKKKQVLWYYNRSKPYGETIAQLVQKIKGH